MPWFRRTALALVAASALLGACKQGEGEFCQIDGDCADGLTCNEASMKCQDPSVTPPAPDASTVPDARPVVDVDSGPDDVDAAAAADAASAADASPADATAPPDAPPAPASEDAAVPAPDAG